MPILIRKFTVEDAASCCRVINASLTTMTGLNDAARRLIISKNHPEILQQELAGCVTVVCEEDGDVVGMGALKQSEVTRLYLLPEYQHRGIGRRILDRLEKEARAKNLSKLVLDASPSSVPFYLAAGYRQIAPRSLSHGAAVFEFVHMDKMLRDSEKESSH